MRSHDLALAFALLATPAACKSDETRSSDRAADRANATDRALDRARHDLARNGVADERVAGRVVRRAVDAAQAEQEFELRRDLLLHAMRARHEVIASQAPMIRAFADTLSLTDSGRIELRDKLATFETRIDDSAHTLEELELMPSTTWSEHANAAEAKLRHLDSARADAWAAVTHAPRIVRGA